MDQKNLKLVTLNSESNEYKIVAESFYESMNHYTHQIVQVSLLILQLLKLLYVTV